MAGQSLKIAKGTLLKNVGYVLLVLLIPLVLWLDFAHGVSRGEDKVLSEPHYRIRQSLAVALSRLHDPPLSGYLAYESIVHDLNEHGFAVWNSDNGRVLSYPDEITAMLDNGSALDRMLLEIQQLRVDPKLPPEIIGANELGYADYIEAAFRIFGVRIASLYYFYFLILGISCLAYAIQFRKQPFLLYVLVVLEGLIFYLIDYAKIWGIQQNTIFNSRLFSALTLPAVAHIVFVLWGLQRPRRTLIIPAATQCAVIAFIVSTRFEVVWQVLLIIATALALALRVVLSRRGDRSRSRILHAVASLWPAALLVLFIAANTLRIDLTAAPQYSSQTETHVFWHNAIMGMLSTSPALWKVYIGSGVPDDSDAAVYRAIDNDYVAQHHSAPPLLDSVHRAAEYEQYARSLALRMIFDHPFEVTIGLYYKLRTQIWEAGMWGSLSLRTLQTPIFIAIAGLLALLMTGSMSANRRQLPRAGIITGSFLCFALITPLLIVPSPLAVGTILCYICVFFLSIAYLTILTYQVVTARVGDLGMRGNRPEVSGRP